MLRSPPLNPFLVPFQLLFRWVGAPLALEWHSPQLSGGIRAGTRSAYRPQPESSHLRTWVGPPSWPVDGCEPSVGPAPNTNSLGIAVTFGPPLPAVIDYSKLEVINDEHGGLPSQLSGIAVPGHQVLHPPPPRCGDLVLGFECQPISLAH